MPSVTVQDAQRLEALIDELTFQKRAPMATLPSVPRIRQVLLGVSTDPATRWAAEWVEALGPVFAPRVTVMHVDAPIYAGYTAFGTPTLATVEDQRDREARLGRKMIEHVVEQLRGAGLEATSRQKEGNPVRELTRAAQDEGADLVVVGSSPRRAIDRFLLGDVADGVKNHVDAHVLLAKGAPTPGDVLCAVDGSAMSKRAAELGLHFARAWGSRMRVVHAIEPPPYADEAATEATQRALERRLELPWGDGRGVDFRLRTGSALEVILQEADEMDARLVAVGNRGMGGLRSLVAGSITNALSHRIPQSVLLVKGPAEEVEDEEGG